MNTLYDLVTKIDALTANSQQVLNALIRSCVASGSSSGYKVKKYGEEIELDRADIYHLYDFYQSWEAEGFPSDESEFNSLLARADARWRVGEGDTSTLASDAVAKHAKILYLTKEQAAKLEDENTREATEAQLNTSYWVNRIRESATPKGTISSAPIPLNLRTPLYDENLSVKSFSQFETYLFPMGYHRAEILGTPGNGEDYVAGGRNWTIDVTDFLTLSGNHILLGNNSLPVNKLEGYGDKSLNISWGNESYAFGNLSLAFGDHSVAQADGSLIFGNHCYGQGIDSFIAGGDRNLTVMDNAFATNQRNTAVAKNSFAANYNNYAGGWGYDFTFIGSADPNVVNTECDVTYIESEDVCVSNKTVTDVLGDSALYKVLCISADDVTLAKLPFEETMQVGDYVVIYNMWVKKDGFQNTATSIDGYAADTVIAKITNITRVNIEGTSDLDHYEVTLSTPVPIKSKNGVFGGGTVSSYMRRVVRHDIDGNLLDRDDVLLGLNSTTFGHGHSAIGHNQTVVGQMSVPNIDAKFVVGTGSSYIFSKDEDVYRSNSLVIGDTYSYMKLANGRSYIGVSTHSQQIDDMGADDNGTVTLPKGTVMATRDKYTHDSTRVATDSKLAFMQAENNQGPVSRVCIGSTMPSTAGVGTYPTALMQSVKGTTVIAGGVTYVDEVTEQKRNLVETLIDASQVIISGDDNAVGIYAKDGIDIRNVNPSRGINIETKNCIALRFKNLVLDGDDTFGSLTATGRALSFILDKQDGSDNNGALDSILWGHTTGKSGFYYIDGGNSNSRLFDAAAITMGTTSKYDGNRLHLYNSVQASITDNKYHVASLSIPEVSTVVPSGYALRPKVTTGIIDGVGGAVGNVLTSKEIPYMDDIGVWSSAPMSCFGFIRGGSSVSTLDAACDLSDIDDYVYMPLLRFDRDSNAWVYNPSKIYAKISASGGSRNESYLLRYNEARIELMHNDNGTTVKFGEMSVMSTSINDNEVDVQGELTFIVNGETSEFLTRISDGFRIPFIPGFATQSTGDKFVQAGTPLANNAIYKRIAGRQQLVTRLDGGYYSSWGCSGDDADDDNVSYYGFGIQPGILCMEIRRHTNFATHWEGDKPYRFRLQGKVPFEATSECMGMNINTRWNDALRACYKNRVLYPISELAAILQGV